ncbi:MAG: periplasmic heavy metal sensor [Proteobacteria bacterium]|nr:periplasmic heavy metal sensor [Pseudomonadota bacterium]
MFIRSAVVAALAFAAAGAATAQQPDRDNVILAEANDTPAQIAERERSEAANDEVRALVYSPEFIFANRRAIGLTDRQRDQMVLDLQGLQRRLISEQEQMQDAREALIAALRVEPANEARVLTALDAVLNIERDVKRLQLQALVRLRDSLTPAQRARLNDLRGAR